MDNELCNVLYKMSLDDQRYRGTTENIADHYRNTLDSLLLNRGLSKTEFNSLPKPRQSVLEKHAFKLARKRLVPVMMQNDSLRVLQETLDAKNTEQFIEITKKYGWLTAKALGCKERFKTVLIFRHAPRKYWDEIRTLIEKERTEKRLSGYEYYLIDNHLKGRPPMTKKPLDFID